MNMHKHLLSSVARQVVNHEFIRFAFVGVLATAIHYLCYYLLLPVLPTNLAFTAGYLISFCFNFWLSARFTFRTSATAKRGVGFALSHLINYALQIVVLNVAIYLGVSEPLAPIPVYLVCIPVNFLLVRYVFKH